MRSGTLALALAGALLCGAVPHGAAHAADTPSEAPAPDLSSVRAKIKAQNYAAALAELRPLAQSNPHADVYNLMAYSYRKSGDLNSAAAYYQKALELDPDHRGALEYQGELFVQTGQMQKAQANLNHLGRLCPLGCEEYRDLKNAIQAAPRR